MEIEKARKNIQNCLTQGDALWQKQNREKFTKAIENLIDLKLKEAEKK